MSYQANGDFIKNKKIEHFNNEKIIEHWEVDNLLYTANGNVGVGTSDPKKKLHVDGDIKANKICLTSADGTDERCIDYSLALLTSEMLRTAIPNNDLEQLSSMTSSQINELITTMNNDITSATLPDDA